jgi:hypothetical protein
MGAAPIRTLFFAALTGYCYIYKQGRGNVNPGSDHPVINSLIFSWAFLEAVWWFWVRPDSSQILSGEMTDEKGW